MSLDPDALPFVDEHGVEVAAAPEAVWESLCRVAEGSFSSAAAARVARLVGCDATVASGPRPLAEGSTFPGFTIARAEVGSELALTGRHRYSEYALVFHLSGEGAATRLRAETRARFPGASGRLYRAAVIGTRGHVLVTTRLLDAIKRRAERQPWVVLYDGDCGLCKWLLAGLLRLDHGRRLQPIALQRPEAEALLADLDPAEWMASMHLVSPEGTRLSGGAALPPLLKLLRGGRLPAAVAARFPRLTSVGYRWVATHRIGISRFVPRRWKQRAAERVCEREFGST